MTNFLHNRCVVVALTRMTVAATVVLFAIRASAQRPAEPPPPAVAALAAPKLWPAGKVIFRQSETERRIREALDRPASFDFDGVSWDKLAETIRKTYGFPVRIEWPALIADGRKNTDETLRGKTTGTLRSALRSLLAGYEMTFVIENEALLITSRTAAGGHTHLRLYQVHDLVVMPADATAAFPRFEPLIRQIMLAVDRESWREFGGTSGDIIAWEGPGSLVLAVVHTEEGHDRVAEFLEQLRHSRNESVAILQAVGAAPPADPPPPPPPPLPRGRTIRPASNTPSKAFSEALDRTTTFDQAEMPLGDFAAEIGRRFEMNVSTDEVALTADGWNSERKLSVKLGRRR